MEADRVIRMGWKSGAACQIYSKSNKKWFHDGEVTRVFTDGTGEWLEVRYNNSTTIKVVWRHGSDIRPVSQMKTPAPASQSTSTHTPSPQVQELSASFKNIKISATKPRKADQRTKCNNIEMTKQDINMLVDVFRDVFQIEGAKETQVGDDDEKAQEKPEQDDDENMFQRFVKTLKRVGSGAVSFVKSLANLKLDESATKEIIAICFKYSELLKMTIDRFCGYGSAHTELGQIMREISNAFTLPSVVIQQMRAAGIDSKKQEATLKELRQQTCSDLHDSTKRFSEKLDEIQERQIPLLQQLARAWPAFNQRILNLLGLLTKSEKEQKSDLSRIRSTMQMFKAAGKLAFRLCSDFIAKPLLCGLGLGSVAGAVGGAVVGGVVGGAAYLYQRRRNRKQLAKNQQQFAKTKENISEIKKMRSAMNRMCKVSDVMGNAIFLETINFQKIKDHDPYKQLKTGGFSRFLFSMDEAILSQVKQLGFTVLKCSECLNKSKQNIELVEKECKKELNSFNHNIQMPLQKMINKED